MAAMPTPKERRPGFAKRGYTFGDGGMPMAPMSSPTGPTAAPPMGPPPGGNPGDVIKQQLQAAPPKDRAKVKKLIAGKLKALIKAKQAAPQAAPMPPPGGAPMPPPQPGMKKGGTVKKAIGGAVRGIGIARKGGGRGRFV